MKRRTPANGKPYEAIVMAASMLKRARRLEMIPYAIRRKYPEANWDGNPTDIAKSFGVEKYTQEVITLAVSGIDRLKKQPDFEFKPLPNDVVTAVLHVWFLCLEETPEMLARLPEGEKQEAKHARSKIGKTKRVITPIDRVAKRVAPTDGMEIDAS